MTVVESIIPELHRGAVPVALDPWPRLHPEALRGLAGDVVRTIEPHTEADPVALLADFLISFGNAVGGGPHAMADGSRHPARLNAVLVGDTAKGRKGTSRANIANVMAKADPDWAHRRVMSGLASGEGLIATVADADDEGKGGATDKRLLVVEPEFARVLAVAGREGATLSPIVRDAWDSGQLRVMTRKEPLVATGAHVSVIGHITRDELKSRLKGGDALNGFANRFLFVGTRRSKLLPSGGNLHPDDLDALGRRVGQALLAARPIGLVRRTADAEGRWAALYEEMAHDDGNGLYNSITARAEAQTLRLSVTYALLDGRNTIGVEHLESAYALWQYCADTARMLFGNATGSPVADKLLRALMQAPDGLTATEQQDVFSRHVTADDLEGARTLLLGLGLVEAKELKTAGRPRKLLVATSAAFKESSR